MRVLVLGVIIVACAACEGALPRGEAVDVSGQWGFELTGGAVREGDAARTLWRIHEPPLTVTAQRIPRQNGHRERTLDAVATAIEERYAAGEVEGEMRATQCSVSGGDGACLDGWIRDGARRLERRGMVVGVGDDFVVLEVIGTDPAAVDRQAELLRATFHERASGGGGE